MRARALRYTLISFLPLFFLSCLPIAGAVGPEGKILCISGGPEGSILSPENLPGELNPPSEAPEGDSVWVVSDDGHLACIVKKVINCTDHTILLSAWLHFNFTGAEQMVDATWSTGQFAHKITVTEGGTYSYDDTGFGCDHHFNTITVPDFFNGPLVISGPTVICQGDLHELTVNDQGYDFLSFTWSPPSNDLTPYPLQVPGNYGLTVTDQNGCIYSDHHNVQLSPPVLPHANGPSLMCPTGDSATIAVTNGPYTSYLWNTDQTTNPITVYEPGLYSVTVTNALGCTGEALWGVGSGAVDGASIQASKPAICAGQTDTLQAMGNLLQFHWSTGQTTKKIVVTQPGNYSVTVTNVSGCTDVLNFTVQGVQPPNPMVAVPPICAGSSATLTAAGGSFASYLWSNGLTTPSITVNTAGNYGVTVSNNIGCTGSASAPVIIAPLPNVTITGPATGCPGQTITLSGPPGMANYQWSNGASTSGIQVSQTITVSLMAVDSNGCSNSDSHTFTVTSSPSPQITVAPYSCNNQLSLSADAGYLTYLWSNGDTTQSTTALAGGNYAVTVTAGIGCSGTAAQTVSIPTNPQVSISGPTQFCADASGVLQASGAFPQYAWTGGATSSSITVAQTGAYTVTVTDANGCTDTDTWSVTATPLPQPAILGPSSICIGNAATLTAPAGFAQYLWSTNASSSSISVSQNGNYGLTVTDANGCTGSDNHALAVNTSLSTQITVAPYACDGQMSLAADPGFATYTWSNGGNTAAISVQNSGQFEVTVSDASGCTGTASQPVVVPTNPSVSIIGPMQICPGGTAQLSLTQAFPQYLWSTGDTLSGIAVQTNGQYDVTVTDGNGCTATANHPLALGNFLSIQITPAPYHCDNQISLTPGGGFSSYNWSTGATSFSIDAPSDGDYAVTVTDAMGCIGSSTITVSIPANPQVSIPAAPPVCDGASGQLQASGAFPMYHWSSGEMSATITAAQSGTYTVTVTDGLGCTATASMPFTVLPPVQTGIAGPAAICPGETAQLSATGGPFAQYAWSTSAATASISVNINGIYAVTVTDANGCTGQAAQAFSISTPPVPQINAAPYACNGQITLNTSFFPGYSWSTGSTSGSTAALANGTYTVTVSDGFGCTGTDEFVVNIPASPGVSVSGPALVCAGASAQLSASGSFPQYQWSNGQSGTSTTVSQSGTFTVTVTDGFGCSATATAQLQVLPPIQPTISGPSAICPGATGQLAALGGPFAQYAWSTGGASSLISVVQAGNYSLTVTDANGCTGTAAHALSVNVPPSPQITAAPYACNNQLALSANAGFSAYQWSNGALTAATTALANGTFSVTVTDAAGCTGTSNFTANIPANPQVSISGPTQFCQGDQVQLLASGSFSQYQWSGGQSGSSISVAQTNTYSVTVTDGNGCTATGNYAVVAHPLSATVFQKISCFAADTGKVMITLSNQFGCDSTVTTHTALSPPILASAAVTSDFNGMAVPCHGDAVGTAQVTPAGGVPPFAFFWSNNAATAALQGLGAGNYAVTVTDANGCTTGASVALTEPPPIVPALVTEPVDCFKPGSIQVTGIQGGTPPFSLHCNGQTIPGNGPAMFPNLPPGPYTVEVTDANGCTAEHPAQLLPPPASSMLAIDDSLWVYAGKPVTLKAPTGFPALSIVWTPGDGLSCTDCPLTKATVQEDTEYDVVLHGFGQCEVRGHYLLRVRPRIYVPNAIRPGSDENSVFTVYSQEDGAVVREMRIYTRWGELVQELRDFTVNGPVGWQGDFQGHPVTPGVYVYYAVVLTADGREELLKGDVTVVR